MVQNEQVATINILAVMSDPNLLGGSFQGDTWKAWKAFLKALFGLRLSTDEFETYTRHTGRFDAPGSDFLEAWLQVGRRGGKSIVIALVVVFLACFRDYSQYLAPGERATIMVIAADRKQARVVMRYVVGFLKEVSFLSRTIVRQTMDSIDLENRVTIEVHTASFRSVRGYKIVAAICDEIAYWHVEGSANPDTEILNALRPGMAEVPGAMLLCLSSPYARRGELWKTYQTHYGQEGSPVLVWQANTRSMNPTVPENVIQQAYERDPAVAASEYGAQFRSDVESCVSHEVMMSCVVIGRYELSPLGAEDRV